MNPEQANLADTNRTVYSILFEQEIIFDSSMAKV